ncbi:MAG: hypothetical protein ACRC33_07300 [Gemmataceae bacterium]
MRPQVNLSYEQMRSLVIQFLAQPGSDPLQLNDLHEGVAKLAVARHGIAPSPDARNGIIELMRGAGVRLTEKDTARVVSIVWDLIIEGVVRPGSESGDAQLPFIYVTEFGRERIKDPRTPYDPDGFLNGVRRDVPGIDGVIMTYLAESLHTFRIGCLLSSAITLGCASEKAVLLLIAAYAESLASPRKESFLKKTEGQMIRRQYDEFSKCLDGHLRALLPGEVKENLDTALTTVFNLLRTHRNEAGHPTGKALVREVAYANINTFPFYVRKVYELIGWLKANAHLP